MTITRAGQESGRPVTANSNQHGAPQDGKWAVKPADGHRASSVHDTPREAIDRAREISRNQQWELYVHGRDGRIRECDSRGSDPTPSKG